MRKKRTIIQFDKDFNYVNSFESVNEAGRKCNIDDASIYKCAKFWNLGCDKKKWKLKYKGNPRKQAGGYIWRFYSDFEDRE